MAKLAASINNLTATLTITRDPGYTWVRYIVLWGDSETSSGSGTPPATLIHTYPSNGDYVVQLNLYDNANGEDEAMMIVKIPPTTPPIPPPALFITCPGNQSINVTSPQTCQNLTLPAPQINGGVPPYTTSYSVGPTAQFCVGSTPILVTVRDSATPTPQQKQCTFNVIVTQLPAPPVGNNLFAANWSNPNASGPNQFNFPFVYSTGLANGFWSYQRIAGGGPTGLDCVRILRNAIADQYTFGWFTNINQAFPLGSDFYFRFQLRLDPGWVFGNHNQGEQENKFVLWGGGSNDPIPSRILYLWERPNSVQHCTLGANPANPGVNTYPDGYGMTGHNMDAWTNQPGNPYGSFSPHINISTECAGPVLIHPPSQVPARIPGPIGAAPIDGWYWIQVYNKSGNSGSGQFKVWANQANFNTPDYTSPGITLGTGGWGTNGGAQGGFTIGGYTAGLTNLNPNIGFRLGRVEVGLTFDSNFRP